jgi:predicted ATPase
LAIPHEKLLKRTRHAGMSINQTVTLWIIVRPSLIADLLSVPTSDHYPPLNLSARQKRQKTIEALVRQLEVLVRRRPVLMIFEDAHWIDPSSRELLDTIIERVARLPALLVITFRPEFHPPWTGQAHVTTLNLTRLGRREGAALAGSVAGSNVLPQKIIEEIIERADGIPLFVEELTKAVVEATVRDADEASTLNRVPPSALSIPATLHASVMARLDRLGPAAREIAQIGADHRARVRLRIACAYRAENRYGGANGAQPPH